MQKKISLLGFLALAFFIGCRPRGSEANQQLVLSWIDALNRHDTDGLAMLYDTAIRIESPNWEGPQQGRAAVRHIYARYFSGTPDLRHRLDHLVVTDSALVVEYQSWGVFSNPEPGTPAYMKGKPYRLENCSRMQIRDGRILLQKNYFDQVSFLRQVGFFDPH